MRRHLNPKGIRPPFGRYHHAVEVRFASRLLYISGQLGVLPDDTVPEGAEAQTECILANIDACLTAAGMARGDIVQLTTYLTDAADRPAYMRVRDEWVADPAPASTLVIVKALALPACRVEIEAVAAA